jgi:hypothetical protein
VREFKVGECVHVLGYGDGIVVGTVPDKWDVQVWMDYGEARQFSKDVVFKKEKQMIKDDDVVTATAGRIRSAAGKCPQANQVLREVYPDVFKEEVKFQVGDIVEYVGNSKTVRGQVGIVTMVEDNTLSVDFWGVGRPCWGTFDYSVKLIHRPNLTCTPK